MLLFIEQENGITCKSRQSTKEETRITRKQEDINHKQYLNDSSPRTVHASAQKSCRFKTRGIVIGSIILTLIVTALGLYFGVFKPGEEISKYFD